MTYCIPWPFELCCIQLIKEINGKISFYFLKVKIWTLLALINRAAQN